MRLCIYGFCSIINNMIISDWIKTATKILENAKISSARLDAELILAETLRKGRTYLHAHPDEEIDPRRLDIAEARIQLRLDRVPLAYILGYKEFYGRKFKVSPHVLVPRPESEDMISLFLALTHEDYLPKTLIDIGTGSGVLGITAKLEKPTLRVILSDISKQALSTAAKNATELNADVTLQQQSLLSGQIEPVDYIFANLPYVDKAWEISPELHHEPEIALFAEDKGLKLIKSLIAQAPRHLASSGLILLEADPEQHQEIINFADAYNLRLVVQQHYILALRLISAKS